MKKILIIPMFAGLVTACSFTGSTTVPVIDNTVSPITQVPNVQPIVTDVKPTQTTPIVTTPAPTTKPAPKPAPVTPVPVTPAPKPSGYTLADVQKHSTSSDCWMILSSGVYDVTSYISQHPGGNQITRGCGKDATQMFMSAGHSSTATALKAQFKIGNLIQ